MEENGWCFYFKQQSDWQSSYLKQKRSRCSGGWREWEDNEVWLGYVEFAAPKGHSHEIEDLEKDVGCRYRFVTLKRARPWSQPKLCLNSGSAVYRWLILENWLNFSKVGSTSIDIIVMGLWPGWRRHLWKMYTQHPTLRVPFLSPTRMEWWHRLLWVIQVWWLPYPLVILFHLYAFPEVIFNSFFF